MTGRDWHQNGVLAGVHGEAIGGSYHSWPD